MKVRINEKPYSFVWGTKCFIKVVNEVQRENPEIIVNVDTVLASLKDPRVLTSIIYNGLLLWCDKNSVEYPFTGYDDFIDKYDEIGDAGFYEHIVTDILESTYMGDSVLKYLEKTFNIEVTDMAEKVKAKKKYLETSDKSLSNLQAMDSAKVKSITARSRNTKSKNTDTN
ncbi:MAG: hypothetical protein [Caudoviricetes sp.]|nr:MAG: hypothetical protein [Caudoviricetes sp.]